MDFTLTSPPGALSTAVKKSISRFSFTSVSASSTADSAEAMPLPPQDALRHLEEASRRIVDDLVKYRRQRPRQAGPGVRDW